MHTPYIPGIYSPLQALHGPSIDSPVLNSPPEATLHQSSTFRPASGFRGLWGPLMPGGSEGLYLEPNSTAMVLAALFVGFWAIILHTPGVQVEIWGAELRSRQVTGNSNSPCSLGFFSSMTTEEIWEARSGALHSGQ